MKIVHQVLLIPNHTNLGFLLALLLPLWAGGFALPVAAAEIGNPPWHLVDLWWDLEQEHTFESYSIDVEIEGELPDESRLYVAPIGLADLNSHNFYGGMQTRSDGYRKDDQRLREIGRGLLLSMWGERSHDAIRPSIGGFCQSSGHEGDFVSVRCAYAWDAGRYTYSVIKMDTQQVDGKPFTWVGAFLHNHQKDEHVFIGALRFPGDILKLGRRVASFVEVYGSRIPLSEIPRFAVTLGPIHVNGQQLNCDEVTAVYPPSIPEVAVAEAVDGRVRIKVGESLAQRPNRSVTLPLRASPDAEG